MTDTVPGLSPWRLAVTPAGAAPTPARLDGDDWIDAVVPGTAASALAAAGRWRPGTPLDLSDRDVWYAATVTGDGPAILDLAGLATVAEIWLDDVLLFESRNVHRRHRLPLTLQAGARISVVFRAMGPHLAAKGPRARWRVPMIPNQGLRLLRAPLFGEMPGWTPARSVVGPLRRLELATASPPPATVERLTARMDGGSGVIEVVLHIGSATKARLVIDGVTVSDFTGDGDTYSAKYIVESPRLWWPHTHGEPNLYHVEVLSDAGRIDLGHVGLREVKRDPEREFGLLINDLPLFCRGAVWTFADPDTLRQDRAASEKWLRLARDAGMNMIRVAGPMLPPERGFFDLCDALGLMVWLDFPFANFDYPAGDPAFVAEVQAETADILEEIGAAPSLAVLCGGSEALQQAAMMGLPPDRWPGPLYDDILAKAAAAARPDVPYIPNAPLGGPLPFVPNRGVAYYYGVGAYMRPIEDARRAELGFAAECLAFSNIPQAATLDRRLPGVPPHDPRWNAGVPRDQSASWDFEEVREHYLAVVFGVDPLRLRRENLPLWLDLSRVVTGHVMAEAFAEWRRKRSPTAGALVWTLQDIMPGAGWGVIDSDGCPKPAWYALKRAFRPVQVTITDEGTNGLALHVINETAEPLPAQLELVCLKDGRTQVLRRSLDIDLAAREAREISAFEVIGAFFDVSYAYRFGPPGHDVTWVRLCHRDSGAALAEAFHHPLGLGHPWPAPTLSGHIEQEPSGPIAVVSADGYAPFVHLDAGAHRAGDDWFPLVPGVERRIALAGDGPVKATLVLPGGRNAIYFAG